jgi:hypothetical protein
MRLGEPVGVVYAKSGLGIKTIMDYHSGDCQNNPKLTNSVIPMKTNGAG